MILQFFALDQHAGSGIGLRVQNNEAGPGIREVGTDHNQRLRAHCRSGARDTIGHELDRVGGIEFFANDPDRKITMPGKRLGERRQASPITATWRFNTACTSGRIQSIWM